MILSLGTDGRAYNYVLKVMESKKNYPYFGLSADSNR